MLKENTATNRTLKQTVCEVTASPFSSRKEHMITAPGVAWDIGRMNVITTHGKMKIRTWTRRR